MLKKLVLIPLVLLCSTSAFASYLDCGDELQISFDIFEGSIYAHFYLTPVDQLTLPANRVEAIQTRELSTRIDVLDENGNPTLDMVWSFNEGSAQYTITANFSERSELRLVEKTKNDSTTVLQCSLELTKDFDFSI